MTICAFWKSKIKTKLIKNQKKKKKQKKQKNVICLKRFWNIINAPIRNSDLKINMDTKWFTINTSPF